VPVYILAGKAELAARQDLVLEWFKMLDAPTKQLVSYEDAAHAVAFEQADEVQRLLTETIVPATYSTPDLARGQLLADTAASRRPG
jgi:alpha-beta hydrolase superfamily lysophospholipase